MDEEVTLWRLYTLEQAEAEFLGGGHLLYALHWQAGFGIANAHRHRLTLLQTLILCALTLLLYRCTVPQRAYYDRTGFESTAAANAAAAAAHAQHTPRRTHGGPPGKEMRRTGDA